MSEMLKVEVCYALPDKKEIVAVKLPAEVVKQLGAEAQRRGTGLNELTAELLRRGLDRESD